MSQINREGTFRGYPIKGVINYSPGGHTQWIADFQAVECYDEDMEQWVDWSGYEESEMRGWFILFDKDVSREPYLNAKQLQKALGWSGESFNELDGAGYAETLVQFRVESDTYNGKTKLKITWIDEANAVPGRKLEGLDKSEISKIDAKYAAALRKLSGGPKPKSVPSKPPVPKPETPSPEATPTAAAKEAAKAALKEQAAEKAKRGKIAEEKAAKREKPKVGRPKKPPVPTAPPATTLEEVEDAIGDTSSDTCTKNEAYQACYARLVEPGVATIDGLNNTWLATIESLGGEEALDGEGWASVRNIVLDELREVPI